MKIFLYLALIFISTCVKAQNTIVPIVGGEFDVTTLSKNDKLLLELGHQDFLYSNTDTIKVFGPDGRTGVIKRDCFLSDCQQSVSIENPINSNVLSSVYPESPLRVELIADPAKGTYTISVFRKGELGHNVLDHKRSFSIVDPEPRIDSVLITGFDGTRLKNVFRIDKTQTLSNIKIRLLGTDVTSSFESVTIQGLPLKKHETEIGTYILSDKWTKESISKLLLGKTQIVIKRQYSNKTTKHGINIEADVPVINEPGLRFSAGINENKTTMTLKVDHLFPEAKLLLENHKDAPDFLSKVGEIEPDVITALSKTISSDIYFNSDLLVNSAPFVVRVKNKDGKISLPKIVTIDRSAENVSAIAFDDNMPLVSGITNRVLFNRLGGDQFLLDEDLKFTLSINGEEGEDIIARKETEDSFSTELKLPEGVYDLTFVLGKSNESNWSGSINNILTKPVINIPQSHAFRGSKVKVYVESATDTNIKHIDSSIDIVETSNGTDKSFDIAIDKESRLSEFDLVLKLKSHEFEGGKISISNWPKPLKNDLMINSSIGEIGEKGLVMSKGGDIDLSFDVQKDTLRRFTVQLIKNDGTRLGVGKPMIQNAEGDSIKARLSTKQVGIQHGETFNIEIANPAGEFLLYPGYVKRQGREKWIITAGLSVLNIPIGENENKSTTSNILDGVNVAGYYMFENVANPSNRYLGIGPNLLIREDEGDLNFAVAISVLLFEKLVFGLSYGDGLGTLVGVNIELANLASIIPKKD